MADTQQQSSHEPPAAGERRRAPRIGSALPLDVSGVKARLTDLSA